MSFIKVTAGDLGSTAGTLNNASNTISETSSSAMSAVNALVSDGWQGAGSASFNAAMDEWNRGAAMVQQALATISNLVKQAETTYTETDTSVASSFAS